MGFPKVGQTNGYCTQEFDHGLLDARWSGRFWFEDDLIHFDTDLGFASRTIKLLAASLAVPISSFGHVLPAVVDVARFGAPKFFSDTKMMRTPSFAQGSEALQRSASGSGQFFEPTSGL